MNREKECESKIPSPGNVRKITVIPVAAAASKYLYTQHIKQCSGTSATPRHSLHRLLQPADVLIHVFIIGEGRKRAED